MQTQPDAIEVTIVRSRKDLRRTTRVVFARQAGWVARMGTPIGFLVGLLALLVEQPVAAGVSLIGAVAARTYCWWGPELAVRRMPAWALRPVTFRLSAEGIQIETEVLRRDVGWQEVTAVAVMADAYFFASPNRRGLILHRRTLSEHDIDAIDSIVQQYWKRTAGAPATSA